MDAVCFDAAVSYSLGKLGSPLLTLKKEQRLAMEAVYEGRNVFVCLPTGKGKNLACLCTRCRCVSL